MCNGTRVFVQEVRESRRVQEQRIVEVDSGVQRDYEFKLAQALQVRELARHFLPAVARASPLTKLTSLDYRCCDVKNKQIQMQRVGCS